MKISKNGQLPLLGIMGLREAYLSTHISRDLYCTFFIIWWLLRCFDGKAASPEPWRPMVLPQPTPERPSHFLIASPLSSSSIYYSSLHSVLPSFKNPLTAKDQIIFWPEQNGDKLEYPFLSLSAK